VACAPAHHLVDQSRLLASTIDKQLTANLPCSRVTTQSMLGVPAQQRGIHPSSRIQFHAKSLHTPVFGQQEPPAAVTRRGDMRNFCDRCNMGGVWGCLGARHSCRGSAAWELTTSANGKMRPRRATD